MGERLALLFMSLLNCGGIVGGIHPGVSGHSARRRRGRGLLIGIAHFWNSLQEAYRQIHIAINSIEQATENLRLQTDYYRTGLCTLSDLLDAQTLYQQSHDKYMEAYAQYALKKREYLQATGQEKY